MAADAKLPKFYGSIHLEKWLVGSSDGLAVLDAAMPYWLETEKGRAFLAKVRNAEEWLRTTEEGRRLIQEATKETVERPRVLVMIWGSGDVRVFAEKAASIKVVNAIGDPFLRDVVVNDTGIGWFDLTQKPNTLPPVSTASGEMRTNLELTLIKKTVDALEAAERATTALGVVNRAT